MSEIGSSAAIEMAILVDPVLRFYRGEKTEISVHCRETVTIFGREFRSPISQYVIKWCIISKNASPKNMITIHGKK